MVEPAECQNPSCKNVVKELIAFVFKDEGRLKLCQSCYSYARHCGTLRTSEMVKKVEERRKRRRAKGDCCHNPNCRITELDGGEYGKYDGEFYCNACAIYSNKHNGELRPKELVEVPKRGSSVVRVFEGCENPNCGRVSRLRGVQLEGVERLRLCSACYTYSRKYNKLRSVDMVKRAERGRKRRESGIKHCFNTNCMSVDLEGGRCGPNGQFYCQACAGYVKAHGGTERPKSLVDAHPVSLSMCENPDCERFSSKLKSIDVTGKGSVKLCIVCYNYARRTGLLRGAELVKRAQQKKRRKTERIPCHNANCRSTAFLQGGYAKCNGEYYCRVCALYIDSHDGNERPKKLVDEQRLRHSRYMWTQHRPDEPREED